MNRWSNVAKIMGLIPFQAWLFQPVFETGKVAKQVHLQFTYVIIFNDIFIYLHLYILYNINLLIIVY